MPSAPRPKPAKPSVNASGSRAARSRNDNQQNVSSQGRPSDRRELWEGSQAAKPQHIPYRGWKDILKRVWSNIDRDNVSLIAAGVAFYGLLSLFPLIIAMVSIYSIFADPGQVEAQLNALSQFIPTEAKEIISHQLHEVVQNSSTVLGWSSALSILAALWSANKGSLALMDGFNVAYGEQEERGFIKKNAVALAFTFGSIIFLLVALASIAIIPALLSFLRLDEVTSLVVGWGRWFVLAAMMLIGLAVLNRYAPSRNDAKWAWVSVGSVASVVLLLMVSAGFSFYVSNFGSYNETYGSIGGVIVLLLWLYLSSYIVLIGAEINAEAELQTMRDTTEGKEKPLGQRGAEKADHVPADKTLPRGSR